MPISEEENRVVSPDGPGYLGSGFSETNKGRKVMVILDKGGHWIGYDYELIKEEVPPPKEE